MTRQPAQAALIHHDAGTAVWPRYRLPGGAINAAPWHDAIARRQLVGTCRCGGYLAPSQPYRVDLVTWYPAECVGRERGDEGCGAQVAAAGPRPRGKPPPRHRPG